MAGIERLGNVFYVVDDMDESVRFYRDLLGLTMKFQDGSRWAAFDVGGTTLALAGAEPSTTAGGGATVSLRVGDVDEWRREAVARGLPVGEVEAGPHERTVEVTDPNGNRLIVYSTV